MCDGKFGGKSWEECGKIQTQIETQVEAVVQGETSTNFPCISTTNFHFLVVK
jgi:hypothetical protein